MSIGKWLGLLEASMLFGTFLWTVLVVIPHLVEDRYLIRVSRLRDEVEQLDALMPGTRRHQDVKVLDDFLAELISVGNIPLRVLAMLAIDLYRFRAGGGRRSDHVSYRGLCLDHQRDLQTIEDRAVREGWQAATLASPLWFALWPVWLYLSRRLQVPAEPEAVCRGAIDKAERYLVKAAEWSTPQPEASGVLQPAR